MGEASKSVQEVSKNALEASKTAAGVSKNTFDDLTYVGKSTFGDLTKSAKEAATKKGLLKVSHRSHNWIFAWYSLHLINTFFRDLASLNNKNRLRMDRHHPDRFNEEILAALN